MREMRLALSNNTKQVARLVASMSKVSTDVASTLASKDAQLASLSAHLADLRVSSASAPAPSPAATPAYGAAYVAAAAHPTYQPDLQIKGRRAPDPLTTPAEWARLDAASSVVSNSPGSSFSVSSASLYSPPNAHIASYWGAVTQNRPSPSEWGI